MKRVRKITEKLIEDILDKSDFTKHSFRVKYPTEGDAFVTIEFIPNTFYSLKISSGRSYRNEYLVTMTPGKYLTDTSKIEASTFEDCVEKIEVWTNRILQDLKDENPLFTKTMSEIEKLRRNFEKEIEKMKLNENDYFDNKEKLELQEKLDNLVERFEELRVQNNITQNELDKVKKEMEGIKTNLNIFPKKIWFTSAGNKILNVLSEVAENGDSAVLIESGNIVGLLQGKTKKANE